MSFRGIKSCLSDKLLAVGGPRTWNVLTVLSCSVDNYVHFRQLLNVHLFK